MCEFCEEDEKVIFEQKMISPCSWGWGGDTKITEEESITIRVGVFIDRGYLRMVDLDDCNCIEAGQKIKIQSCPFCGKKFN